ncbi:MAG: DUF120 domain-containing protein [Candidatus Aenigmarchaeota archaeon]|nr:DUF120 domain-containing protein [Candidatus Aenigmarchaeota archaeon]
MIVSGKVTTGVLRGKPLIEQIYFRLVGILGFTPFKGTMDVQMDKELNIEGYSTKSVEHKFIDGTLHRDCWLAPVILHVGAERYDCWAMQQVDGIYPKNIIEIIAKDKIREIFNLKDGDAVKIQFTGNEKKGGPRGIIHKGKTPLAIFKKKK